MEDGKMAVNAIFRYAQFASVWLWREAGAEPERVFIQVAIRFNERFRGNISDHPFRWLGASYLLRSYYDGDLKDTRNSKKQTGWPCYCRRYCCQSLHPRDYKTNLGNEDFAYVSEETYKLQLAGQLSQPWVWIIDPLDGTRDFIDRTGEYAIHIALVNEGRPVLAVVAWPEAEKLYYAALSGTL